MPTRSPLGSEVKTFEPELAELVAPVFSEPKSFFATS